MLELPGRLVELRDVRAEDAPALRRIHATPAVAMWWGDPGPEFPFDADRGTTPLTIVRDGDVAGYLQFAEEPDPHHRHAAIDLFVDPARHRQGIATDALAVAVRYLTAGRGHHRVTIDPALDNLVAIRCYERAGFRRVGVLQAAWRDTRTGAWRDTLLMELVVLPDAGGT